MSDLSSRIRLVTGDITQLDVDAIVTAANEALLGGGGVDGAVHHAAGPELVAASRRLAPCPAGEARITGAFNLPVSHVIHAVGPIYHDGESGEPATLASAYTAALGLAADEEINRMAFPCISTGVFAFPNRAAALIAIDTTVAWLQSHPFPRVVTFCCYQPVDHALYLERLTELGIAQS